MTLDFFSLSLARREQVRNPLQDNLGLKKHFVVPKTQLLVSLFSQKISARFVLFHLGSVLPSVKLDYQAMFETAEIGDKRAHSERGSQTRPVGLNLESLALLAVRTSQTP
jgi:hypothetical protein